MQIGELISSFRSLESILTTIEKIESQNALHVDEDWEKYCERISPLLNVILYDTSKYMLSLEDKFISSKNDFHLLVTFEYNKIYSKYLLTPDKVSEFYCKGDKIYFNTNNEIIYFKSSYIYDIDANTRYRFKINADITGSLVYFWIVEFFNNEKINQTKWSLIDGINEIPFLTIKGTNRIKIMLRFRGKGHAHFKSIKLEKCLTLDDVVTIYPSKISIKNLSCAYILDQITESFLKPCCNAQHLPRNEYKIFLEKYRPNFLFVESCKEGNNNTFGSLDEKNFGLHKLEPILKECKRLGIPTVFWNNKDPVNYRIFLNVAKLFDYIFTTDANMIPVYKRDIGRNVNVLPFAAQPVFHNPGLENKISRRAFFAGIWNAMEKGRCADFHWLDGIMNNLGIKYDIFDRNQSLVSINNRWPDNYRDKILGYLTPREIYEVSKSYGFQMNINSIKDSPTMFSSRVFESMACGTPVISTWSRGIKEMFSDLVIMGEHGKINEELLYTLITDDKFYMDFQEKCILAVMRNHIWDKRLEYIARKLAIDAKYCMPSIAMHAMASSEEEAWKILEFFNGQSWEEKKLVLKLKPFGDYHKFLNMNDSSLRFILDDEYQQKTDEFFNTTFHTEFELNQNYSPTWLEMHIYRHYGLLEVKID